MINYMMRNRNQSENYSHHILTCLANTHSPIEIDPIRGLMCWLPLNCFVATFQNDDVWIHRRGENARIARIAYLPNYRCTMSSIDSSMKWIKSQSWHYTWIRRPIEYFVLNSCSLFLFFLSIIDAASPNTDENIYKAKLIESIDTFVHCRQ